MKVAELKAQLSRIPDTAEVNLVIDGEELNVEHVLYFKNENVLWISAPETVGPSDEDDLEQLSLCDLTGIIPKLASICTASAEPKGGPIEDKCKPTSKARQA